MGQEKTPLTATPTSTSASPTDVREARLKVYDRVLSMVSALSLIVGGIWAVYTYSQARHKEIDQKAADAKRDADLKQKELLARNNELKYQIFKDRKQAYTFFRTLNGFNPTGSPQNYFWRGKSNV